jgi:HEAT repeat protein
LTTFGTEIPEWALIALVASAGVAGFLVLRLAHALWGDRRLRERASRSPLLRDLIASMEERPSLGVRRTLGREEFLRDVDVVERWLSEREDQSYFDDSELVARHRHGLRRKNRWPQRAASAGLLGWTENPQAAPALVKVISAPDEPPALREVARQALGRMRHREVVRALAEGLDGVCESERDLAVEVIASFGNTAVEVLEPDWRDPQSSTARRRSVAYLLGQIPTANSMSLLVDGLDDSDPEVRIEAGRALSRHSDPRIVRRLLDMSLSDESAVVRTASTAILLKAHRDEVNEFLFREYQTADRAKRFRIVDCLVECGEDGRTFLLSILLDPDRRLASRAAEALAELGAISGAIEALRTRGYDAPANELLIDAGRAGQLQPLFDELSDPESPALLAIVRIIARIGDPSAGPHLVALLERRPVDRIHSRVVDALRASGDDSQLEILLPLLDSSDEWLRKSVVDYVAAFGDENDCEAVFSVLGDRNPWVRESALRILESIAPDLERQAPVVERLDDKYDFVRAAAIRCLCAMGAFETLLESDVLELVAETRIREALLQGLRHHAPVQAMPLITRLAAFCSDRDLDLLRHAAGRAVDQLDEPEVDLLIFSYASPSEDASSRWFATVGWCRASEEAADRWRNELQNDPDPKIRASMAVALSEREQNRDEVLMTLYTALSDPAPIVVRGALFTAARLAMVELESALADARAHEDEDVRLDATLALAILPGDHHGRSHLNVEDLRRRQIIASTAARLHRMQPSAIVDWVRHLRDTQDRKIISAWVDQLHPLFRYVRNRAGDRDDIASKVLLCDKPFEAEQVLLRELMENPDPAERLFALQAAIALDTRRCHGRILAAFYTDSSIQLRARALVHLVQHDAFGGRASYIERAIRDPSAELCASAARLCALLPEDVALAMLGRELNSRDGQVPETIVETLADLMQGDVPGTLDRLRIQGTTIQFYARLAEVLDHCAGAEATKALDELFHYAASEVRVASLGPLVRRLGVEGWDLIDRALRDRSPAVRSRAVRELGNRRNHELAANTPRLLAAITRSHVDPDPEVRSRTALALAQVALPGRDRFLLVLESDEDQRVAAVARKTRAELSRRQHTATRPSR